MTKSRPAIAPCMFADADNVDRDADKSICTKCRLLKQTICDLLFLGDFSGLRCKPDIMWLVVGGY